MRLLILAGTAEARDLVAQIGSRHEVTASLAGATAKPLPYDAPTRRGGFGGIEGLIDWMRAAGTEAVIDATHPFAAHMPWHAQAAAQALALPRLRLIRPAWAPEPGDCWDMFDTVSGAAAALPPRAKAFLTTGANTVMDYAGARAAALYLRAIDPPREELPGLQVILKRPPFTEASEIDLFHQLGITHLVTKNAGGVAAAPKLAAARALGLPVLMVRRPAPVPGPCTETVAGALDWLATL